MKCNAKENCLFKDSKSECLNPHIDEQHPCTFREDYRPPVRPCHSVIHK